ncbi:MAG TPA: LysR family transcriptional regulator substrate-binding protein, partial [Patescibacteria group bacterium]
LIKRNTKQLIITSDGMAVYATAKKILSLWGNIKDPTKRNDKKEKISIGMFDNAALKLASFFSKKNAIQFEMIIDSSKKLQQYVKQGLLDICICVVNIQNKQLSETNLIYTTEETLVPVSSKKWSSNIKEIPFILYNSNSETRNYIDYTFQKNNINPIIVAQSTSTSFMKELAINGIGVALLPKNFVDSEIKEKRLFIQKLPFEWKRTIGLYLPKGGSLPSESKLISHVWSYFK